MTHGPAFTADAGSARRPAACKSHSYDAYIFADIVDTALLDEHPDRKLAQQMSTEFQVTPQAPPTFLFTTSADTSVPAENSGAFYLALHKADGGAG